jgi:hypothetical protein
MLIMATLDPEKHEKRPRTAGSNVETLDRGEPIAKCMYERET